MVNLTYPDVQLFKSKKNLFAAGARNLGIRSAKGNYFLFIDDDNEISPTLIEELLKLFHSDIQVGVAGPKMYYYNGNKRIWWAGASINLITSRTVYRGLNELDTGQYDQIVETGHVPNVFMIKKEVIKAVGDFDEDYQILYEESDLAERARMMGYKVLYCPKALTYHKLLLPGNNRKPFKLPMRAYFQARNRIVYMKKHSSRWQFLIFMLCFYPLFLIWYLLQTLLACDYHSLKMYITGTYDGLLYGLSGNLRRYY